MWHIDILFIISKPHLFVSGWFPYHLHSSSSFTLHTLSHIYSYFFVSNIFYTYITSEIEPVIAERIFYCNDYFALIFLLTSLSTIFFTIIIIIIQFYILYNSLLGDDGHISASTRSLETQHMNSCKECCPLRIPNDVNYP